MGTTNDPQARIAELEKENRRWMRLAGIHRLTELPNSLMLFQVVLPKLLTTDVGEISCILLCPDGLGEINQQHGRIAGDELIRQIAKFIKEQLEAQEQLFHCDGANFAILIPESPEGHARRRANEIKGKLNEGPFSVDGTKINRLTCSAGTASIAAIKPSAIDTHTAQLYVDLCDRLYQAKERGGNAVIGSPRHSN